MPQGIEPIKGHPGFYRRPGSKVVYFRVGKGKRRRWRNAPNLPSAQVKRRNLQTDFDRGELTLDGQTLVADYGRRWVKSYVGRTSRGFQEHTRDDYEARLERDCFVFFATTRLCDVTPTLVREFYAWVAKRGAICRSCRNTPGKRERCRNCGGTGRKGELSLSTVRLAAAPFKAMMATAYEDGVINRNTAAGVRLAIPQPTEAQLLAEDDEDEGPVKALSDDQLRRVLERLRHRYPYWLLFVRCLVELGLRIGEAVELRWRDINFEPEGYEGAIVSVQRRWYRGRVGRPKSRFGRRSLKLAPEVAAVLRVHYERELAAGRGGPKDLVWTTAVEHVRVDQGNLARDVLHPVRDELGLPWLTWHIFRHTAITRRFLSGRWNPKQVQIFAGHHDVAFTVSTYVHLLSDELPDPEPMTELPHLEVAV